MEGHCSTGQSPQWAVVPMEEEEYFECVCNLSYPACKAHALYHIAICDLSCCTIISTLSNKRYDFGKNLLNTKCVF